MYIMKMKLYYGAIALMWLLSSCTPSGGVGSREFKGIDNYGDFYGIIVVDNHEYLRTSYGLSHAGTCKQCKHELDSIVKNAVNEAFEASMEENWNE